MFVQFFVWKAPFLQKHECKFHHCLRKIITQLFFVGRKIFLCPRCSKPYRSRKAMYAHRKFSCENIKSFFCELCSASYFYKKNLKKHMNTCHTKNVMKYESDNIIYLSDLKNPNAKYME